MPLNDDCHSIDSFWDRFYLKGVLTDVGFSGDPRQIGSVLAWTAAAGGAH
jgi:hypothetical protein